MTRPTIMLLAVALAGCHATTRDAARTEGTGEPPFTLGLPAVSPPLVVVQPGVSVMTDVDVEVFYTDGYYWARRDGRWFRAHDHRGSWAPMEDRQVPVSIVNSPPGLYLRHRGDGGRPTASAPAS
jgi:hypothetical protein